MASPATVASGAPSSAVMSGSQAAVASPHRSPVAAAVAAGHKAAANNALPSLGLVSKSRSLQQRKRKRLNAVLDKLSHHISCSNGNLFDGEDNHHNSSGSGSSNNNNEDHDDEDLDNSNAKMFGRSEQQQNQQYGVDPAGQDAGAAVATAASSTGQNPRGAGPSSTPLGRKMSSAALRRELWRDNHHLQQHEQPPPIAVSAHQLQDQQQQPVLPLQQQVFKFDAPDRERYLSGGSSVTTETSIAVSGPNSNAVNHPSVIAVQHDGTSQDHEDGHIFSPASGRY